MVEHNWLQNHEKSSAKMDENSCTGSYLAMLLTHVGIVGIYISGMADGIVSTICLAITADNYLAKMYFCVFIIIGQQHHEENSLSILGREKFTASVVK